MNKISIIIVNWNSGLQVLKCLETISRQSKNIIAEIVIVDNASTDNSIEIFSKIQCENLKMHYIHNAKNMGFGFACNQGVTLATGEYFLFLNPDTALLNDSLIAPYDFLNQEANQSIGIVGIQIVDEKNTVIRSCARFPNFSMLLAQAFGFHKIGSLNFLDHLLLQWDHTETRIVDHVIGAFYFVRGKVFKQLGGFDERFFVYLEDLDFSLRAKIIGWNTIYLSEPKMFHEGGGTSYQVKDRRLFYSLRSKILYSYKHFSSFNAWILLFSILTIELVARLGFSVLRLSKEDFANTVRGFAMLYVDLPNILRVAFRGDLQS